MARIFFHCRQDHENVDIIPFCRMKCYNKNKQEVIVIRQKGRITAAHGWFQMALVCCTPPNNASVGPSESITQTASRAVKPFLQLTAECRRALPRHIFSLDKLRLRMGRPESPSNTWFLKPPASKSQMPSQSVQPFLDDRL